MAQAEYAEARCSQCRRPFRHGGGRRPVVCGLPECRAREHYTADDWAGLGRMARARQAAGVELTELDHEALRRTEAP